MPDPVNRSIISYEQWLALTDDQRQEAHLYKWNVYARENIGFAYTAAGRFAISSTVRILDIRVGVYHGGEYILELCVADEEVNSLPARLASQSEGFRIMFIGSSNFYP